MAEKGIGWQVGRPNLPAADLRWKHKVTGLVQHSDHAELTVETPDGFFTMQAAWAIARTIVA